MHMFNRLNIHIFVLFMSKAVALPLQYKRIRKHIIHLKKNNHDTIRECADIGIIQ